MSSWQTGSTKAMSDKRKKQLEYINNKLYSSLPPEKNTYLTLESSTNIIKNEEISKSCLENIDAILYINLEIRPDREEHILKEIKKIDPLLSKTHRIDAVLCKENGALGCSLSHIKALELILGNPSWKNVMLLEDDFTFYTDNSNNLHYIINYMLNELKVYDMILLGVGIDRLKMEDTVNENIKRVLSSQTTSGYIVNSKYINTLLSNYRESSSNMKQFGWKSEWCLDQYWKKIMPISNWYTYKNRIAYQYENYSDIEGKVISYKC